MNWNGEISLSESQLLVNNLIWANGLSRAVNGPTRGHIFDIFLVRLEKTTISQEILPGKSEYERILRKQIFSGNLLPVFVKILQNLTKQA